MSARFDPWRENSKIVENSPRGEGMRREFRFGFCVTRNVQINMVCRYGFVTNGFVLEQYFFKVVAQLGERRRDCSVQTFHVFDVCANIRQ